MGRVSKNEWTHHTFNPWRGCQHSVTADGSTHPGCAHCYAEALSKRAPKSLGTWGEDGTRVVASPSMWAKPLAWDRAAKAAGERHRVFCASLADVFEDWPGPILDSHGGKLAARPISDVSVDRPATLDDLRRDLFNVIDRTPYLDWLLLTKRPQNVRRMTPPHPLDMGPDVIDIRMHTVRRNVWLGTSVSNQATADELIPDLLKCRDLASVLFLSCEPLLGPIDLARNLAPRPSTQMTAFSVSSIAYGMTRRGKTSTGRELDGLLWDEFPSFAGEVPR